MEKIPGIFDMHIHSAPDIAPRKTDDLELAKAAAAAGMGGIMIKSHLGSSVERAYLVNQMVPNIRVCGGLVLNFPVGGLNPFAVDSYVRMGAKEVWMPTLSAEYTLSYQKAHVPLADRIAFNQAHGGASIPPSMKVQPGIPGRGRRTGGGSPSWMKRGKLSPRFGRSSRFWLPEM